MDARLPPAPSRLASLCTPPHSPALRPRSAQAPADVDESHAPGPAHESHFDDDWVTVNAGGSRYEVTKQTLASSGGMLAVCAYPEKHQFHARAPGAEIKFDRNAKAFGHIIEWLRTHKVPSGLSRSEQHALVQEGKYFDLSDMVKELKLFYPLREAKREARGTNGYLPAYIDLIVAEFKTYGWASMDRRLNKLAKIQSNTHGQYLDHLKMLDNRGSLFDDLRRAVLYAGGPHDSMLRDRGAIRSLAAYFVACHKSTLLHRLPEMHRLPERTQDFCSELYGQVDMLSLAFARDPACLMALEKKAHLLQQGDDLDWQIQTYFSESETYGGFLSRFPKGVASNSERRALAIETLEILVDRQPDHPTAWSDLVKLYRETGRAKEADNALKRAAQASLASSVVALEIA